MATGAPPVSAPTSVPCVLQLIIGEGLLLLRKLVLVLSQVRQMLLRWPKWLKCVAVVILRRSCLGQSIVCCFTCCQASSTDVTLSLLAAQPHRALHHWQTWAPPADVWRNEPAILKWQMTPINFAYQVRQSGRRRECRSGSEQQQISNEAEALRKHQRGCCCRSAP